MGQLYLLPMFDKRTPQINEISDLKTIFKKNEENKKKAFLKPVEILRNKRAMRRSSWKNTAGRPQRRTAIMLQSTSCNCLAGGFQLDSVG